jgi:hypothetical protein
MYLEYSTWNWISLKSIFNIYFLLFLMLLSHVYDSFEIQNYNNMLEISRNAKKMLFLYR